MGVGGGIPLIYAHTISQNPYLTYIDYITSLDDFEEHEESRLNFDRFDEFYEYGIVDDSPQGFFQYTAMITNINQFLLFWHALYIDEHTESFSNEMIEQFFDLDLNPVVYMTEKDVTIRYITFTKFYGVVENYLVLDQNTPSIRIDLWHELLIQYHIGYAF